MKLRALLLLSLVYLSPIAASKVSMLAPSSTQIKATATLIETMLGMPTADAQTARGVARRTTRRTARRVTRRHAYYYSLPATGCVVRLVGGVRYSYCGGVYYKTTIDDAGKTAYIIVTP